MTQPKFQALADLVGKRRQDHLNEIHRSPNRDWEKKQGGQAQPSFQQANLTFEDLSPVLEVFQNFDERSREIEWTYYSASGEFLLQFGFPLATNHYEIHSIHPELFLAREEMRGFLEAINRRLESAYPVLELVAEEGRNPRIQRKAK